jgi:hypothetical protein
MIVSGDKDNRWRMFKLAKYLRAAYAIHLRHTYVEQYELRLMEFYSVNRFSSSAYLRHNFMA